MLYLFYLYLSFNYFSSFYLYINFLFCCYIHYLKLSSYHYQLQRVRFPLNLNHLWNYLLEILGQFSLFLKSLANLVCITLIWLSLVQIWLEFRYMLRFKHQIKVWIVNVSIFIYIYTWGLVNWSNCCSFSGLTLIEFFRYS